MLRAKRPQRAASRHRRAARAQRRGMTLLELLLVLAILVAIAAVAMPSFQGPLEDFRLRKSAELIRARWSKARVQAMRSGQTMVFRFQVGSNRFRVEPWLTDESFLESSQPTLLGAAGSPGSPLPAQQAVAAQGPGVVAASGQPGAPPSSEEALPEQVSFVGIVAATSIRDALAQQTLQNQQPLSTENWSPPVLFYPDGTSSDLRLIMTNVRQTFVVLQLRGLTGVAQVSDFLSAEELPQ